MPNYCLVENGVVVEGPRTLPKNWKNISNLNVLSDARLKALGWLPVLEVKPDYDPRIQSRSGPALTVEADQVTAVWTVAERPLAEVQESLVANLSRQTGDDIAQAAPVEEQINAILAALKHWQGKSADALMTMAEVNAISEAVDSRRRDHKQKKNAILAATTLAEAVAAAA